jgi:SET domain-containing protein
MKTSKGEVIDPTYKGNLARFINHSKKMANLIPRTIKISE